MRAGISSDKLKQASDRGARNALKLELAARRSVFVPKIGMRPVCGICDEPIIESPDMHEALITKAQGTYLPSSVLNCAGNCVLVHPGGKTGGCHAIAHTEEGYVKCAMHIYKYEGIDVPVKFLFDAYNLSKIHDIEPAMRFSSALMECGVEGLVVESAWRRLDAKL